MVRYRYNPQVVPPAPLVHITLRNPITGEEIVDLPAQLDTAADRTVLPATVVNALGLVEVRKIEVAGLGGHVQWRPAYVIDLQIRELRPVVVTALSMEGEAFVLLGRDVLNQFRVVLDGLNSLSKSTEGGANDQT